MLVGKSQMRQNSRTPVTTNPHISYDLVSTQLPILHIMTSHCFSCGMREKKNGSQGWSYSYQLT